MHPIELKRCPEAFKLQAYSIMVVGFFVALLTAILFGSIVNFVVGAYDGSRILTFLIVMAITSVAVTLAYYKWRDDKYVLTEEGILISSSLSPTKKKRKIYLYESIISVSCNQNYFGTKFNYGEIHVTIPKLEDKLILKDVENPEEQLLLMQKFVKANAGRNNLVT